MAGMSDTLENAVLDHALGRTELSFDTTLFLSLHTDDTSGTGTDTAGTEVTGGSYARQAIEVNAASSGTATGPVSQVKVTTMPACTVKSIGIYTAVTSGTLYWLGDVTTEKAVLAGDTISVAAGQISVSLA